MTERKGIGDPRHLNADELHQALAISLREKNKSEAETVVREYRRRNVRIPQNTYRWLYGKWPDLAKRRFRFGPDD